MSEKEATARIKIDKLLEAAGWCFFPKGGAAANTHYMWTKLIAGFLLLAQTEVWSSPGSRWHHT